MKTTQQQRLDYRDALDGQWPGPSILRDFLDDIEMLTAQVAERDRLLNEAKGYFEHSQGGTMLNVPAVRAWISDLSSLSGKGERNG